MNTDAFNNLMNKYGNEAEELKVAEARAAARRKTIAKIKKFILLLMLGGVGFAVWQNWPTLSIPAKKMWATVTGASATVVNSGEATKNKAKDLHELAAKRNAEMDATFK